MVKDAVAEVVTVDDSVMDVDREELGDLDEDAFLLHDGVGVRVSDGVTEGDFVTLGDSEDVTEFDGETLGDLLTVGVTEGVVENVGVDDDESDAPVDQDGVTVVDTVTDGDTVMETVYDMEDDTV